MTEPTLEEIFRYCTENPDNLSISQLLDKFPTHRGELESLLAVDSYLKRSLPQAMPLDRRAAVKAKLLASLSERNAEEQAASGPVVKRRAPEATGEAGQGGILSGLGRRVFQGRRLVWTVSSVVAILLMVWYVSSVSLADSPFYNVKIATENQLIKLSNGTENLVKSHFQLANVRLLDLRAMQTAGTFARSQPAVDNYIFHYRSGVGIWESISRESRVQLSKLLYVSSIAGENTLSGFGSLVDSLPTVTQNNIGEMLSYLKELNTTTGDELIELGITLDSVLGEADPSFSSLLTPVPVLFTPTPLPSSAATAAPTSPTSTTSALPTTGPPIELAISAVRVPDPQNSDLLYFPETGHTLRGDFLDYWQQQGGLLQFGYPITEEFNEHDPSTGTTYLVQYFERVRFEYHPERQALNKVVLGLLGSERASRSAAVAAFQPTQAIATPGALYFPEPGHNVPPEFVSYWQAHGGVEVYGYPVSEALYETSRTNGKTYLVQYFERSRIELHPEMPEQFRIILGLLGTERLQELRVIP